MTLCISVTPYIFVTDDHVCHCVFPIPFLLAVEHPTLLSAFVIAIGHSVRGVI